MLLNYTLPKIVNNYSYSFYIFLVILKIALKSEKDTRKAFLIILKLLELQIVLCITSTNEETKKNYCELRHYNDLALLVLLVLLSK